MGIVLLVWCLNGNILNGEKTGQGCDNIYKQIAVFGITQTLLDVHHIWINAI